MTNTSALAPIEIVEIAPRLIAMVRRTVTFADMPQAQREARSLLDAALKAAAVEPCGPTVTVWRPPQAGAIDYTPGVFVAEAFPVPGAVSLFTLPQGRAAHLRMDGPYAGLPEAWQRLFRASASQGLALSGLNWEVYGNPDEGGADLFAHLVDEPTA